MPEILKFSITSFSLKYFFFFLIYIFNILYFTVRSLFSITPTLITLRMIRRQICVTKNFTLRRELCNKMGKKYRVMFKKVIRNSVEEASPLCFP